MKQKRFFARLSIYALSQITGIDPGKISLIERGLKIPRDDEKEKIAKALRTSIKEIFPAGQAKIDAQSEEG